MVNIVPSFIEIRLLSTEISRHSK